MLIKLALSSAALLLLGMPTPVPPDAADQTVSPPMVAEPNEPHRIELAPGQPDPPSFVAEPENPTAVEFIAEPEDLELVCFVTVNRPIDVCARRAAPNRAIVPDYERAP